MTDTADLNLVLGRILPDDALHERAKGHVAEISPLIVPFSVGVELLFIAHRFELGHVEALGAVEAHFKLERAAVLYTAAEALAAEEVKTVFDAVHLADAFHRNGSLHTADDELHRTPYPTIGF